MRRVPMRLTIAALSLVIFASTIAPAAEKSATEKAPGPGDVPPAALGLTRAGDAIETTQFAGKVLVVTFWASWCGPCRAELPILENLQKAGKGSIQVVAVNIEERDQFRAVARAMAPFTLTITNDYYKRYSTAYGVHGIPHMVIIGKDGKILHVHRGYSESALDGFVAEINAALAKG